MTPQNTPTKKEVSNAVIVALTDLQSAVVGLSALVTSLAWGSSAVSLHDPRIADVNKAVAKAGEAIAQAQAQQGGE